MSEPTADHDAKTAIEITVGVVLGVILLFVVLGILYCKKARSSPPIHSVEYPVVRVLPQPDLYPPRNTLTVPTFGNELPRETGPRYDEERELHTGCWELFCGTCCGSDPRGQKGRGGGGRNPYNNSGPYYNPNNSFYDGRPHPDSSFLSYFPDGAQYSYNPPPIPRCGNGRTRRRPRSPRRRSGVTRPPSIYTYPNIPRSISSSSISGVYIPPNNSLSNLPPLPDSPSPAPSSVFHPHSPPSTIFTASSSYSLSDLHDPHLSHQKLPIAEPGPLHLDSESSDSDLDAAHSQNTQLSSRTSTDSGIDVYHYPHPGQLVDFSRGSRSSTTSSSDTVRADVGRRRSNDSGRNSRFRWPSRSASTSQLSKVSRSVNTERSHSETRLKRIKGGGVRFGFRSGSRSRRRPGSVSMSENSQSNLQQNYQSPEPIHRQDSLPVVHHPSPPPPLSDTSSSMGVEVRDGAFAAKPSLTRSISTSNTVNSSSNCSDYVPAVVMTGAFEVLSSDNTSSTVRSIASGKDFVHKTPSAYSEVAPSTNSATASLSSSHNSPDSATSLVPPPHSSSSSDLSSTKSSSKPPVSIAAFSPLAESLPSIDSTPSHFFIEPEEQAFNSDVASSQPINRPMSPRAPITPSTHSPEPSRVNSPKPSFSTTTAEEKDAREPRPTAIQEKQLEVPVSALAPTTTGANSPMSMRATVESVCDSDDFREDRRGLEEFVCHKDA